VYNLVDQVGAGLIGPRTLYALAAVAAVYFFIVVTRAN
jgi:hypothetical protein